ncbi:hypothetical protein C6Y14_18965 [Streptomyces dioscori]|uniref:Uncharacterized protein n=1 Tax=Streptomyces dioscori TaxID=2109333 RepID=A0A2P8Q6F0_9ACTN|nr:hypothetical protein C6Y14_18965 [Streptomyces dioscori]
MPTPGAAAPEPPHRAERARPQSPDGLKKEGGAQPPPSFLRGAGNCAADPHRPAPDSAPPPLPHRRARSHPRERALVRR